MELLNVQPVDTCGYVQTRFRDNVILNSTQKKIIRAAEPGVVLFVHRIDAQYGYGCSFLAGFLGQRCGWEHGMDVVGPKWTREMLHTGNDVVIDCTFAFQHMTAKKNNLTRAIVAGPNQRVIVMCHGSPMHPNSMDISSCPKSDYE
jgi:hypothetical protein